MADDRIRRRRREIEDGPANAGHDRLDREHLDAVGRDEDRWLDQQDWLARECEWEQLDADLDRYMDDDAWPRPSEEPLRSPLVLTVTERELVAGVLTTVAGSMVLIGNQHAALQLTILAAKVRPQ